MPSLVAESAEIEAEELRRCLGHLTAISALPGLWLGMDAQHVVESLVDALGRTIGADMLYVDWAIDHAVRAEAASLGGNRDALSRNQLEAVRRFFRDRPAAQDSAEHTRPAGEDGAPGNGTAAATQHGDAGTAALGEMGDYQVAEISFGRGAKVGRMSAAWRRSEPPTTNARLIMRVACNHAALTLERLSIEQELRQKEAELRDFVEHAAIGLHWVGPEGTILWANAAELDMLGYRPEEYIGRPIRDFHVDEHVIADILSRLERNEELREYEARLRCRDGSLKDVSISSNTYWEGGQFRHTRCFTQDVTRRKQAERRLSAKHAVTRTLAAADSFDAAAPRILRSLLQGLEFQVCGLWLLDEAANVLKLAAMETDGTESLHPFVVKCRQTSFAAGIGLPGRVWADRAPAWLDDAPADDNFPRAAAAVEAGLHAAAAFPILIGSEFFGVIEIFASRRLPPDDALLAMISGAGAQIGQFIRQTRATQALRESEQRLRFTLDAARVGSWDWEIETGRVTWSENLESIHGRTPGTFGGTLMDVLNEVFLPDRQRLERAIAGALQGDGLFEASYRFLRPDGSLGWLHSQGRAMFDGEGRPIRMAGICMDVTEQRRGEEVTQLLAEAGAHLGQSLDYESSLQVVANLLVPSMGDWCAIDLLGPDQTPRTSAVAHAVPEKAALVRELLLHYAPRPGEEHGVVHVLETGQPELLPRITEEMLQAAAQDDRHLHLLRELGVHSAMFVPLRARGRTLGALSLISADSARRYARDDLTLLEELATRCALAVDNARLYEAAQGEIEQRKITEQLLANAHDAAAAASAAKSEFLANMSHEIRTPMTAILGYADILSARLQSAQDLESVETIRRNGRFLLEIINDILDLSKIEAGKLEVERRRFRVDELIADVRSLMEVRAQEKHLMMSVDFDGLIPETIDSDPTRLRQILVNLLGNAIKFTSAGRVQLRVSHSAEEEQLRIDVLDTGIGITAEQMSRLFEPFSQGDSSVARRFGGTGLGLVISRRLAALLNGKIECTSEPGRGSSFILTVGTGPLAGVPLIKPRLDAKPAAESAPRPLSLDCRVLVVDDRRDVRFLAEHFIREAGGVVASAPNGEEALEVVRQSAESDQPVDLILLDMHMPVLDGYATAARLRAQGFHGPLIAMTANAMQGDRERCLAAGCDDYTSKPLDRPRLIERIAHYTQNVTVEQLQRRRSVSRISHDRQHPQALPTSDIGGCRVLLVDDSEDICRMLKLLLEARGHEVRVAFDGRSAIVAAAEFAPEVAVLDLTLPDMSGCDVARRLRSLPEMRESVLIALSGHSESAVVRQAEQAGFHHHVLKPVDVASLEQLFPVAAPSGGAT